MSGEGDRPIEGRGGTAPPDLRAALPLVLLVLAGCAVVGVAAHGIQLVFPPAATTDAGVLALRIAGALAVGGGVGALLVLGKRSPPASAGSADPTRVALTTAAAIMAVLAVAAVLAQPIEIPPAPGAWSAGAPSQSGPRASADTLPRGTTDWEGGMGIASESQLEQLDTIEATAQADDSEAWDRLRDLARTFLLALLVVAGLWLLARRLRLGGGEAAAEPPLSPEEAEEGLAASLGELTSGARDPRGRITAAYLRLLEALEAAGVPRAPYEAPHEHLHRALGPLGLSREPLHRLAELHVVARFTERPVTDRERAAASAALEESLATLRAIHGAALVRAGPRVPSS